MNDPRHYRAIERALCRFARGDDDGEILFFLRRIDHPAAREAAELLRRRLRHRAQTALDAALEGMAGPEDGSGLEWFASTRRVAPTPDRTCGHEP